MKVIGVTGPSGAGKSVFCGFLRDRGCAILDCDAIYHGLIDAPSECTRELSREENFGPSILREDGSVDRGKLAAAVFAPGAEERLRLLNRVSHRHVTERVLALLGQLAGGEKPPRAAVIDAPLLFQAGMESLCDVTVALLALRERRLSRLEERDGLGTEALEQRLNAAPPDGYYAERADETVINDGTPEALEAKAERLLERILSDTPGGIAATDFCRKGGPGLSADRTDEKKNR